MKRVALFGKYSTDSDLDNVASLITELSRNGVELFLENRFFDHLKRTTVLEGKEYPTFSSSEDLKVGFDLFLSLGGDGTLLKAATYVADNGLPILGINTGRLGFLASFEHKYFVENLKRVISGEYVISERSLIQLVHSNDLEHSFALNEIAISRKETTSMISVKAYLGDEFLNTFWADGLIVSTPTGSTGYSLSCGGPIVSPDNACFVITPIAPHNLNVRPIVVSDTHKIRLIVESRAKEYYISLDSRLASFPMETKVELELAPFKINLVQYDQEAYFETLRQKLLWGRDSRS